MPSSPRPWRAGDRGRGTRPQADSHRRARPVSRAGPPSPCPSPKRGEGTEVGEAFRSRGHWVASRYPLSSRKGRRARSPNAPCPSPLTPQSPPAVPSADGQTLHRSEHIPRRGTLTRGPPPLTPRGRPSGPPSWSGSFCRREVPQPQEAPRALPLSAPPPHARKPQKPRAEEEHRAGLGDHAVSAAGVAAAVGDP